MQLKKILKAGFFAILQAFLWIVIPLYTLSETAELINSIDKAKEIMQILLLPSFSKLTLVLIIGGIFLVVSSILKNLFEPCKIENLFGKILSYVAGLYISIGVLSFGNAFGFGIATLSASTKNIGIKIGFNLRVFVILLIIIFVLKCFNAILQFLVSKEETDHKERVIII